MPKSNIHEWINTAGVVLALVASSASAYFAWQANNLKAENVAIRVQKELGCPLRSHDLEALEADLIGLCWVITITNTSENKTSIADMEVMSDNGAIYGMFNNDILELDGKPLDSPFDIEGGSSKKFLVRAPLKLTGSTRKIFQQIRAEAGQKFPTWNLEKLVKEMAKHNLDPLGNKIEAKFFSGGGYTIKWIENHDVYYKFSIGTGRGATFSKKMSWLFA